jgi:hypothetical protein
VASVWKQYPARTPKFLKKKTKKKNQKKKKKKKEPNSKKLPYYSPFSASSSQMGQRSFGSKARKSN